MKLPFLKMFMKKRRSNGAIWASLAGLGISAAVFGLTRGKKKMQNLPFQNMMGNMTKQNGANGTGRENAFKNMMNNISPRTNINSMDNAALAEFSEELMASALNKDQH